MLRRLLPAILLLGLAALPAVAGEDPGSAGAGAPAAGAPVSPYPERMLVETLDNGLQVVIEERHAVPIARVHAYMKIGSIYEGEWLGSGLSHYMEHIVSGGSTRREVTMPDGTTKTVGRTEDENKALVESIGGDTNASTFYNYTQFYITTKSEMVETAVDLVSDYLQHCQFDPAEVKREQRVVQQELFMHRDDPGRELGRIFAETMFKVHPARVPVIGYPDCIQRVTRDDMLRFYKKYYTPQNCVVAIVGDVDKYAAFDLVKKYFGGWKRKSLEPYVIPQEPEQTAMRWVEHEHGATQTARVAMGVPTIPLQHPDLYALDMLSNVLGLGDASRLAQKFEHDPHRAVVATNLGTGSWTPVYGAGRFACFFQADTVEHARALVWEIWDEMSRLKEELVSPGEIARALKVLEKYHWRGQATVDDRAEELASNLAWLNDPLHDDHYLENIRKVTPEQIREVARKYLRKDRLSVVIVKPPEKTAPREATVAHETEGKVRKVVLDNGLTLLLRRIPDYGLVDAVAEFNGGVIYETEKTNGLFFLMANTFWRGTKDRPFPALMDAMDRLGMEISADSQNNVFMVKMNCLATDLDQALDLWSDVLLHPAIEESWVERVKSILIHRTLPNLAVTPEEMCQKVIRNTLYAHHPYRMQRFGTAETLSTFTAADVRDLYQTFTRPNNCVLAVYGDIDLDATEQTLRKLFGGWEKGPIPASGVVEEPPLEKPMTVELTNKQVRTNLRIAWRAYSRQQKKERQAMSVMSAIIGAQGWLHHRLREGKADYVYSVYTQPYIGDRAGHFFIDTNFAPQDEKVVLDVIDGVIRDIRAGNFSDEELALAKKMILCYDALGKKEDKDVVASDALSELYGEGYDSDVRYYEGIRKVTREDVVRVANDIFSKPALRVLVRPGNPPEPGR